MRRWCGVGDQAYDGAGCAPGEPGQPAHGPVPRRPAEPAAARRHHRAEPGQREQPDRRDDRRGPGRGGRPGRLGRRPAARAAAGGPGVRLRGRRRRRRDPAAGRAVRPGDVPARRGAVTRWRRRPRSGAGGRASCSTGWPRSSPRPASSAGEVLGLRRGRARRGRPVRRRAVVHSQTTGWDAVPLGDDAAGRHRRCRCSWRTAPRRSARPRCGSAPAAAPGTR